MSAVTVVPDQLKKVIGPPVDPVDQQANELANPEAGVTPYVNYDAQAPAPVTPTSDAVDLPTPDTTAPAPTLDRGNKLLDMIKQAIGVRGAEPDAGKPYTGPIDEGAKQKSVFSRLGGIGNALAAAAGTPEQQEIAEKRAEFGPELKAKTELAKASLASLTGYRQGRIENAADTNDIKQQAQQGAMRAKGYIDDGQGAYRPMTSDEILADPVLSKNQDLKRAAIMEKAATGDLAKARQDVLMNPQNPTFVQHQQEIESRLAMARAHLDLARSAAARQAEASDLSQQKALFDYGANTRGQVLTNDNAAPGMVLDGAGNVVPNKRASVIQPTAAARTKAGQANAIVDAGEQLVKHIEQNADLIGPIASRYHDLESFIGNPPPEFKGLAAELESWIALHPAAHGFRGQNAVREFQKAFGPIEMTPEALIAGIRGSYNTMGALQQEGTPRTTPTNPGRGSGTAGGKVRKYNSTTGKLE